jgi:hypothetical protein
VTDFFLFLILCELFDMRRDNELVKDGTKEGEEVGG